MSIAFKQNFIYAIVSFYILFTTSVQHRLCGYNLKNIMLCMKMSDIHPDVSPCRQAVIFVYEGK